MNPEVKKQWLDDLRSGRFAQVNGQLAYMEDEKIIGFCCLGVLCDQAVRKDLAISVETNLGTVTYNDSDILLPPSVVRWAEIPSEMLDSDGDIQVPLAVVERFVDAKTFAVLVKSAAARKGGLNSDHIGISEVNDMAVPFDVIADILEEVL